jgi:hypothetical protein
MPVTATVTGTATRTDVVLRAQNDVVLRTQNDVVLRAQKNQ